VPKEGRRLRVDLKSPLRRLAVTGFSSGTKVNGIIQNPSAVRGGKLFLAVWVVWTVCGFGRKGRGNSTLEGPGAKAERGKRGGWPALSPAFGEAWGQISLSYSLEQQFLSHVLNPCHPERSPREWNEQGRSRRIPSGCPWPCGFREFHRRALIYNPTHVQGALSKGESLAEMP
jgi:hypothetical protein